MTSFKFFLSCSSISDVSLVSSTTSLATLVLLRGLEGAPLGLTLLPLLLFAVLEDIEDDLEEDVGDGEDLLSRAESPGYPSGGGNPTPVSGAGSSNRSDFLSWKSFEKRSPQKFEGCLILKHLQRFSKAITKVLGDNF